VDPFSLEGGEPVVAFVGFFAQSVDGILVLHLSFSLGCIGRGSQDVVDICQDDCFLVGFDREHMFDTNQKQYRG